MKKIAVITPYYKESLDVLDKCHKSVSDQSLKADHFFIADGHPNTNLDQWNVKHIILPSAHADNGNTPRGIGSVLAASEGYDLIAYLDADNWFHPNHLASLVKLHELTRADICSSFRTIHTLAGEEIVGLQDSDEENLMHIDTSCYIFSKNAFDLFEIWLKMPKILSPLCDRVFFQGLIQSGLRFESTKQKTVAFRTQYKIHYLMANLPPPPGAKENVGKDCYEYLSSLDGIKQAVTRLGFVPL
jgi:glycosyltransferase involved in cell wall biosynthesis